MTYAFTFSAKLNCQETEVLLQRLRGMVPSVAETVEADDAGYHVRFAGGEAKLRCSGDLLSIEIDAEDAQICMGIRAALATTLFEQLVEPALVLALRHGDSGTPPSAA